MKSVLISIKPKWCELIANGRKTIEVRKTRPKCDTPFKCYIYCTLSELLTRSHYNGEIYVATSKKHQKALERNGNTTLSGKVIGEFVCNKIDRLAICGYDNRNTELRRVDDNLTAYDLDYDYLNKCQLSPDNLKKYSNGSGLYGWHISDIVIYDKLKSIKEFYHNGVKRGAKVTRPPQSWCYAEELKE